MRSAHSSFSGQGGTDSRYSDQNSNYNDQMSRDDFASSASLDHRWQADMYNQPQPPKGAAPTGDQSQYSLNPSEENEEFFNNDHINFDAQANDDIFGASPKPPSRRDTERNGDCDSEIEEAWKHNVDITPEKKTFLGIKGI